MEDISPPENATFKVIARRSNKNFPLTSPEINREVGAHIFRNIEGLSVDVHNGYKFIYRNKERNRLICTAIITMLPSAVWSHR